MTRKIKQFKCQNKNDIGAFSTGTAFAEVYPILQLGIQGMPGTKFYLNGSIYPICIGLSGIYDLEIKNGVMIHKLEFDETSLEKYGENNIPGLIVDIIYEEKEN